MGCLIGTSEACFLFGERPSLSGLRLRDLGERPSLSGLRLRDLVGERPYLSGLRLRDLVGERPYLSGLWLLDFVQVFFVIYVVTFSKSIIILCSPNEDFGRRNKRTNTCAHRWPLHRSRSNGRAAMDRTNGFVLVNGTDSSRASRSVGLSAATKWHTR